MSNTEDRVDITWPLNAWPTAEEWIEWFARCPRHQQVECVTRMIAAAESAETCFVQNHANLPTPADLAAARVEAAETAREHPVTLLRAVISYFDTNDCDLPLTLVEEIRRETGGER